MKEHYKEQLQDMLKNSFAQPQELVTELNGQLYVTDLEESISSKNLILAEHALEDHLSNQEELDFIVEHLLWARSLAQKAYENTNMAYGNTGKLIRDMSAVAAGLDVAAKSMMPLAGECADTLNILKAGYTDSRIEQIAEITNGLTHNAAKEPELILEQSMELNRAIAEIGWKTQIKTLRELMIKLGELSDKVRTEYNKEKALVDEYDHRLINAQQVNIHASLTLAEAEARSTTMDEALHWLVDFTNLQSLIKPVSSKTTLANMDDPGSTKEKFVNEVKVKVALAQAVLEEATFLKQSYGTLESEAHLYIQSANADATTVKSLSADLKVALETSRRQFEALERVKDHSKAFLKAVQSLVNMGLEAISSISELSAMINDEKVKNPLLSSDLISKATRLKTEADKLGNELIIAYSKVISAFALANQALAFIQVTQKVLEELSCLVLKESNNTTFCADEGLGLKDLIELRSQSADQGYKHAQEKVEEAVAHYNKAVVDYENAINALRKSE